MESLRHSLRSSPTEIIPIHLRTCSFTLLVGFLLDQYRKQFPTLSLTVKLFIILFWLV